MELYHSATFVCTQSCINGLWVVRDFCWAVWAARPVLKFSSIMLRYVTFFFFHVFKGKIGEIIDSLYMVASALKCCIKGKGGKNINIFDVA